MIVAGIVKDSICDGENFRDVLFVSGCPWNCSGCHNSKSKDKNYGSYYSVDLLSQLLGESENDITISGGDPLTYQYDEVYELVKTLKTRYEKNIWIYTGYTYDEIIKNERLLRILEFVDVIVDGKFDIDRRHNNPNPRFRGSDNQRIIDIRESFISQYMVEWEDKG